MIYKVLVGICIAGLSACDAKYLGESAHAETKEQKKIEKFLPRDKIFESSKDLKQALDNKIYILIDNKEGCVVSEKPLNKDIVIIYKENERFKYDLVKPILKKDNTDCVSSLAFVTDEPNYFYDINKKSKNLIRGYGFELNEKQIMYSDNKIRGIDLIGNRIPNVITECFSKEGSHFNIFGGRNNEEKLLHRYTFLDMDIQTSCTENDKIFSLGSLDLKNNTKQ